MEELLPEQIAAIRWAVIAGKQLQKDHPEIADLYRSGRTHPEIVEELQVQIRYSISSIQVAIRAVCFALIGFKIPGLDRCDPFPGLLGGDESEELCRQHRSNSSIGMRDAGVGLFGIDVATQRKNKSKGGRTTKSKAKGIFALTAEQRSANAIKVYDSGKGIAALSPEEKSEAGKKAFQAKKGIHSLDSDGKRAACLKSLETQGIKTWSDEEDAFLRIVLTSKEYTLLEKSCRKRDYERINREYHERFPDQEQRTHVAIRSRLIDLIGTVPEGELIQLGAIEWSDAEKLYLLAALHSGEYTREYRHRRTTYEYAKLANDLNVTFHGGELVRIVKGTRQKALYLLNHPHPPEVDSSRGA